jgi:hypothetical protein
LNPLQQTANQTSLTYCHYRNILHSRECKKVEQFILLLLLPLVVMVVASAAAAAAVMVVVVLVVLVVFVLFKRLKHTLNYPGMGTRLIFAKTVRRRRSLDITWR